MHGQRMKNIMGEYYLTGELKSFIREALQIELKVFMIHIAATDCLMT